MELRLDSAFKKEDIPTVVHFSSGRVEYPEAISPCCWSHVDTIPSPDRKLGVRVEILNKDSTSKGPDVGHIGFLLVPYLQGRNVGIGLGGSHVVDNRSHSYSFCPEFVRKARVDEHASGRANDCPDGPFSSPIVLRCVRC